MILLVTSISNSAGEHLIYNLLNRWKEKSIMEEKENKIRILLFMLSILKDNIGGEYLTF